jgi:polyisoprenyl-teichoic acid--peptidoglycan teichoic acid transferase
MRTSQPRTAKAEQAKNASTRMNLPPRWLIIPILIFLLILIVGVVKAVQFYNRIHTDNGKIEPPKTSYNIVLLGYGGGQHEGTYLTDTIIVAHIDLEKKKAVLVSIPRDAWIQLPTQSKEIFHTKINTAYQLALNPEDYPDLDTSYIEENPAGFVNYGIKQITGLTVDAYVAIDFQGFVKVIDELGGIDVVVDKSFEDPEYPVEGKENDTCGKQDKELEEALKIATQDARLAFPCRYENLKFASGPAHLSGEQALKFARSRHSLQDGGDFARANRQQKVIEAVKQKVLSIGFIPKILPLMEQLQNHIRTDIDPQLISKFLSLATKSNEFSITRVILSNDNYLTDAFSDQGQYILISKDGEDKWNSIHKAIRDAMLGVTPTPKVTITIGPKKVISN